MSILFSKCPNCGFSQPSPPRPPYEYNGYLKPDLPRILELLEEGKTPHEIAAALGHGGSAYAMIAYIRKRYGLDPMQKNETAQRNEEIVARYRAGSTTFSQLGREYGISGARIREIVGTLERQAEQTAKAKLVRQQMKRIEDIPITMLDLPARVFHCLVTEGYETVGDVLQLHDFVLLRIPNFGRTSLDQLRHSIAVLQEVP